jgi:hypothetical protein
VITSEEHLARNRLQWVELARQGILAAVGGDVVHSRFKVFPTVDPLRFILTISLKLPLAKKTRKPLRDFIRAWAGEFDCEVPIIDIQNFRVQAEVLTKRRVWSRDAKGKFKKEPRRFERRVR